MTFLTFHGGRPCFASSAGGTPRCVPTRAIEFTASASASASTTSGTPVCSAHSSASIAPATSPVTARSATVNPLTPTTPEW